MTTYEWMKQKRQEAMDHYVTFSPTDQGRVAERTRARRLHVAWNYAIIELETVGHPEDLTDDVVRDIIGSWIDQVENREDLRMNDGNLELRELMLQVAEEILLRILN